MATPLPAVPISIGNTLYGMDVNTIQQAYAQQQAQAQQMAAQNATAAGRQAQQALSEYQGAAQSAVPQDPALAQLVSTLLPSIADAITGGTGAQERGAQRREETRADRLKQRADNLTILRDRYNQAAEKASHAQDLETEIKMRSKIDLINRQLDEMKANANFEHQKELTRLKHQNISQPKPTTAGGLKPPTSAQRAIALTQLNNGNYKSFLGRIQSNEGFKADTTVARRMASISKAHPEVAQDPDFQEAWRYMGGQVPGAQSR